MYLLRFLLLSFVIGQSVVLAAQSPVDLRAKVDSIAEAAMVKHQLVGLSIGVVVKGEGYSYAYGVKDIRSGQAVTPSSVFHTASISKVFTAMGILQLVDAGRLSLDTKLTEVLSYLKYSDPGINEITVQHLLQHTSGLPDVNNYRWGRNVDGPDALRNSLTAKKLKLKFDPGSGKLYSNLGYNLLGLIIEETTGDYFADYLRINLLRRYGMQDADFHYPNIKSETTVRPHSKHWLTRKPHPRKTYPYNPDHAPSSTLNASSEDLVAWMLRFLSEEEDVLSSATKATMMGIDETTSVSGSFGFQKYPHEVRALVGHYGGDKGFRSFLLIDPQRDVGIVVLTNGDWGEDFRQEVGYGALRIIEDLTL